jgi:hypothetical protein
MNNGLIECWMIIKRMAVVQWLNRSRIKIKFGGGRGLRHPQSMLVLIIKGMAANEPVTVHIGQSCLKIYADAKVGSTRLIRLKETAVKHIRATGQQRSKRVQAEKIGKSALNMAGNVDYQVAIVGKHAEMGCWMFAEQAQV